MRLFLSRFDLFILARLYWLGALLFVLFVAAYPFPFLFPLAKTALVALGFIVAVDLLVLLLPKKAVIAERQLAEKWSLGDENKVTIEIHNRLRFLWFAEVIDELPAELQIRNFSKKLLLQPLAQKMIHYHVRPVQRGLLRFNHIRILLSTPLGLFGRRYTCGNPLSVPVYPSIVQMKKYSLYTVTRLARYYGVKKMRRIGHSYEFEQIKDYVQGDDLRHVNWKATGRTHMLKTNHFVEERAQPVYCVVDKSRNMNLAFDGMTLLDYAVNTSLVISNTALQKGDKAGLITFSDKVGTAIRADNNSGSLRAIMDSLYVQKYRQTEPDFEFLYNAIGRVANNRSLIFLFTNFETITSLERVLPVLRKINQQHLLVVVMFENAEVAKLAYEPSVSLSEIYTRMVARQMLDNKRQMISMLRKHGIQSLVTLPQELSINTLNKYIELKAKGLV